MHVSQRCTVLHMHFLFHFDISFRLYLYALIEGQQDSSTAMICISCKFIREMTVSSMSCLSLSSHFFQSMTVLRIYNNLCAACFRKRAARRVRDTVEPKTSEIIKRISECQVFCCF